VVHAEFSAARPLPVANSVSLESLISEFESDPEMASELEQARRNLAYSLYSAEGGTLTQLRLAVGLSQARLAELIGTSQPHIARIEGGRNDPGTEMIAKLADALGVSEERAFKAIRRQRMRKEN
jgi:ribosome-binding protein aMBF1 (putative translation factor)